MGFLNLNSNPSFANRTEIPRPVLLIYTAPLRLVRARNEPIKEDRSRRK
nr:hypothetical protein [uncultured Campylobacter sp.]